MTLRTPKYGASNRKRARKNKDKRYECPRCHKLSVKRTSNSVWKCRSKSCGAEFAGGAYALKTEAGEIVTRMINEYAQSA